MQYQVAELLPTASQSKFKQIFYYTRCSTPKRVTSFASPISAL